ncbi:hypothetical protein DLAC_10921 [Tieghemostelium lacteum]|uniref:Uncharacterized protein n=1 Tax=Tieghemostelium lacteum TaxID=361077 RepID=A0A151Z2Q3_TIELA|nr:hypothetical protein DLAC_10921 [Tieghemostelium lacteum]|eukprot:KYQ88236.1 hypothetical protein DLAC_10921 [Tieghemostelium lacteum]
MKFVVTVILLVCICTFSFKTIVADKIVNGDDWEIPSWAGVSQNSGFFSEERDSSVAVNVGVFDVAWRQVNPSKDTYTFTSTATVKGMSFSSFSTQNQTTNAFWMRIWNSGVDWAPTYIPTLCQVSSIGVDYDNDPHLPIWNACVWGEMKKMYTYIFKTLNMRADNRLKFIYVPGAFNWCEFDFTEIGNYSTATGYTYQQFNTWFQQAMQDLVDIFGDYSYKLVYTGEDYPFDVESWPQAKNLLAKDAVSKGMGIRNGITEVFNFHLAEIPAYGVTIDTNTGYLIFNQSWPLQMNPNRVIGTENECFKDCGFTVSNANLFYAIKMSNLKALQMGVNWLYLVPGPSYMTTYPELYNWLRYSLGKQGNSAFDSWVALRSAQDLFWADDDSINWPNKPYIKNLERFLYQRDMAPGAYTRVGTLLKKDIYGSSNTDNGQAYEGLRTNMANGNNSMVFFVDDTFIKGNSGDIQIKVSFLDGGSTQFKLQYMNTNSQLTNSSTVQVNATQTYKTYTFEFTNINFSNQMSPGNSDFKILNLGPGDLEVQFVRVVKMQALPPVTPTTTTTTTGGDSTPSSTTSSKLDISASNSNFNVNFVLILSILSILYLFK